MNVLERLATSLGRRDEVPNQELARDIAAAKDADAVTDLVRLLGGRDKNIQSDCIKALYETAVLAPALVAPHAQAFIALLGNRNNRLVWGAMIALDAIAGEVPDTLFAALPTILQAADSGSVITRDHAVGILVALASGTHRATAAPLLLEQLLRCPVNQLPMYAEKVMPVAGDDIRHELVRILTQRLSDLEKDSQRKRVGKVLKRLS